jgi:hypothetical protein
VQRLGRVLDLSARNDPDAPEHFDGLSVSLVNVAQANAVRGCRVAELLRVNLDAQKNSTSSTKTQSLLVTKT